MVDDGNALLCSGTLDERFGGSRHQDNAYDSPREELETQLVDPDTVYSETHDDTRITAQRRHSRGRHRLQSVSEGSEEEPYLMEQVDNGQRRRRKRSSSSSTRPPRRSSHAHFHMATMMLLPPVMEEEDVFTDSHESPEQHRTMSASTKRFYAHQHFYSGFRRPLPTVKEVPRLE